VVVGNSRVSFHGCKTNCPRCGAWADISDGTYTENQGRLEVVSGSPATRAMADAINALVAKVRAAADVNPIYGEAGKEELLSALEVYSPALASVLRPVASRLTLALFLMVITWLMAQHIDVSMNLNELVDQGIVMFSSEPQSKIDELIQLHTGTKTDPQSDTNGASKPLKSGDKPAINDVKTKHLDKGKRSKPRLSHTERLARRSNRPPSQQPRT
jgi:hypothetical protein